MNDKLKEIRDRVINNNPNSLLCLKATDNLKCLDEIQSETYQLGRQEVIDEIKNTITEHFRDRYTNGTKFIDVKIILSKLNNLKK